MHADAVNHAPESPSRMAWFDSTSKEVVRRWQFWLWFVGSALPCVALIVLDYLWFAHRRRNEMRADLLVVSDAVLVSVTGLPID